MERSNLDSNFCRGASRLSHPTGYDALSCFHCAIKRWCCCSTAACSLPVEAVLLLYRLEREHGIPSGLRDTLKSEQSNSGPQLLLPPGQSYSHLVAGSSASAEMARTSSQLRTAALEHEREYTTARNNYFSLIQIQARRPTFSAFWSVSVSISPGS